jgi:hypothetical protein
MPAERIAVYTAIFGGFDLLRPDPPLIPGIDYICFTDDRDSASSGWRIEYSEPRYADPRLSAKLFKCNPHLVLPDYRHTVWIDGNIWIKPKARRGKGSLVADFMQPLDDGGLVLLKHPTRTSIFEEADASLTGDKYSGQRIREQVEHYRSCGFPGNGLCAGGVLVRDSRNPQIRDFNERWMEENVRWSIQDQLSLAYLVWKLRMRPVVLPYQVGRNPYFWLRPHRSHL